MSSSSVNSSVALTSSSRTSGRARTRPGSASWKPRASRDAQRRSNASDRSRVSPSPSRRRPSRPPAEYRQASRGLCRPQVRAARVRSGTNGGLRRRTAAGHDDPSPRRGTTRTCRNRPPLPPRPSSPSSSPRSTRPARSAASSTSCPRDGRFEAIVVDDGSDDGTGDEARAHGAAVVIRHEVRGGVGAAIRDGWRAGVARERPYLALLSGDDQHEPARARRRARRAARPPRPTTSRARAGCGAAGSWARRQPRPRARGSTRSCSACSSAAA